MLDALYLLSLTKVAEWAQEFYNLRGNTNIQKLFYGYVQLQF